MSRPPVALPAKAVDAAIKEYFAAAHRIVGSPPVDFDQLGEQEKEQWRAVWRAALRTFVNIWLP